MIFRRTSSGISNLHLFTGVESVVFLEGGISITRNDLENGNFSNNSDDIRYWQTLFSFYLPNRKFQFRSVGSKEIVKSIALDIENGNVNNVIAIMDRDFDNLTGKIIDYPNVLYTYGYSWENDCWSKTTISEAILALTGLCRTKLNTVEVEVDSLLSQFCAVVKQCIKVDSLMIQNGSSFFDRKKHARYISLSKNKKPEMSKEELTKSFLDARNKLPRPIYRKGKLADNTMCDCFGHLLAYYCYKILSYVVRYIYKQPAVAIQYATTVIVDKYIAAMNCGKLPELKVFYERQFNRIT